VKESNVQAFQKEFGLVFAPGISSENTAKTQENQLYDKAWNVRQKDKVFTASKQPSTSSTSKSFKQELQEFRNKMQGSSSEKNAQTEEKLFDRALNVRQKDKIVTGSKQRPIVLKASSIPKFFQQDLQEQINKGLQEWTKKQGSSSENNAQTEEKLFDRVWNERQKNKTVTGSKKLPSKTTENSDKDGKDMASNKETVAIPEKKSKEVQDSESPSKLTPKK